MDRAERQREADGGSTGQVAGTFLLNGEGRDLPPGLTVARLLSDLDLPAGKVGVERNREIVPRSTFDAATLHPGDVVEIVTFVGGG